MSDFNERNERIDKILANYFKDPIDKPCPYWEASKELFKLFKAGESYWREKCRNDAMSAKRSGWVDAVELYKATVEGLTVIGDAEIQFIIDTWSFEDRCTNELLVNRTAQAQLQDSKEKLLRGIE